MVVLDVSVVVWERIWSVSLQGACVLAVDVPAVVKELKRATAETCDRVNHASPELFRDSSKTSSCTGRLPVRKPGT